MSVRLTKEQAKELGLAAPPRASKYRNVPTVYGGVRYASKGEAARAQALEFLQECGKVLLWIGQPKFRLGCPENVYVADFLVCWADGRVMAEDVKGHRTAKFRRDINLWRAYGRCPLRIITNGEVVGVIEPGRS
jgi:hypothetical protein